MPHRLATVALLALTAACSAGGPAPAESTPPVSAPPLRLSAALTQDSRDAARDRIAVIVANDGGAEVIPEVIEYTDPRLSRPLVAGRLRAIPPGGERRFPLPLADPVCGAPGSDAIAGPARLVVRVGTAEAVVRVVDDVGVLERWEERRCAELDVSAVAALTFTDVRVRGSGPVPESADLVLTATPSGEGSGAYVIESVAGTPVFTSPGEPWAPGIIVTADGAPAEVVLPARPARCDGHVFGESAGATSFLVAVRLNGERREVLVRMSPQVAAEALEFAVEACRAGG